MGDKDMRDRAEWMKPKDDVILEYMRDVGASSPQEVAENLGIHVKYANERLIELYKYRMLDRPVRGFYRVNEVATGYLEEEKDASDLEPRDE